MSLSKLNKIDKEKGAIFNSHIDGKKFCLSPEESIRIQLGLNSDIVMIMDECPKNTSNYEIIKNSTELSIIPHVEISLRAIICIVTPPCRLCRARLGVRPGAAVRGSGIGIGRGWRVLRAAVWSS